tara:strand:+ start:815 stop:994 length:180 start_codon:yes stop_codon:yes gene_type:complete
MKKDEDYEYLEIPEWLFPTPGPGHVGPFTLMAEAMHSWMLSKFYPVYRENSRWAGELEA